MTSHSTLSPWDLTWGDVDPARHPFAVDAVSDVIREAAANSWDDVTRVLADRFGRWVCGWYWTQGSSGGPVTAFCCFAHWPQGATRAETIEAALVEWRAWLEALAAQFDALALPAGPPRDRLAAWERAVTVLVTDVVAQTQASDAWYVHCEQVLTWFLTYQGVPKNRRAALIDKAIGGRFESWTEPGPEVVADLGRRIAAAAQQAVRHA